VRLKELLVHVGVLDRFAQQIGWEVDVSGASHGLLSLGRANDSVQAREYVVSFEYALRAAAYRAQQLALGYVL
jgi:hypothetical protein